MSWCEVGEILSNPENCGDVFWADRITVPVFYVPEDEPVPQCV